MSSGKQKSSTKVDEPETSKLVAVKMISKYKVITTCQQQHIYNELKYSAQLNHPFIVPVIGVHQDSKFLYLVQEFAP